MAHLTANNAYSTLASGISSTATSLTLATGDGAKFRSPTSPDDFLLTLYTTDTNGNVTNYEIVLVTARSGDVCTIARSGSDPRLTDVTTPQTWASGTKVMLAVTAGTLDRKIPFGGAMGLLIPAGRFGKVPITTASASSAAWTTGTLYLTPFQLASAHVLTSLGVHCTTVGGAGVVARLGLYADDGTGLPSTLMLDAGTLAMDTLTGERLISITQALSSGQWWTALVIQNAGSLPSIAYSPGSNGGVLILPRSSASLGTVSSYTLSNVTGALPSTITMSGIGESSYSPVVQLGA